MVRAVILICAILRLLPASGAPLDLEERANTIAPSQDPFYLVPASVGSVPPGTILQHRKPPAPIAAFGIARANLKESHQILYRTTDSHGNATATVLTVLVPYNADYTKLLSYQVAEDAAALDCAPSYAFQLASATGGLLGTIVSQAELLLIQAALEQGWVVVVPDFQGPNAAFLANRLAGQAILDGIRAAVSSSNITGIDPHPRIAMWGYSGGGITTAWAAELQPTYAPELKIAAAAFGGTEPKIQAVTGVVNRGPFAGLIAAGMLGLANEYPVIADKIQASLKPQYAALFSKAKKQCLAANALDFMFKDVVAMFNGPDITKLPDTVEIMNQNDMGKAVPKIPIYLYKGVFDEVSHIKDTDDIYKHYCSQNVSVQYRREVLAEHGIAAVTGAPGALAFLIDIMNGRPAHTGCSNSTVWSSLASPEAAAVLPQFILDSLLDLIGKPIGPSFFG